MKVISAPVGLKGFDCNVPLTYNMARKFVDFGHRYVARYLPRRHTSPIDLSANETAQILHAGLAITGVQHVEAGEWIPSKQKGFDYGSMAIAHAEACKIPLGTSLWLDLESVDKSVSVEMICDYCNTWWTRVAESGYTPGIYLGWQNGLTGHEAYYLLKFEYYWAAYNLNADQYPVKRGVCMQQYKQKVLGNVQYDPDIIKKDNYDMTPLLCVPDEWDV